MKRTIRILLLAVMSVCLLSCGKGGSKEIYKGGDVFTPTPIAASPFKVKVENVWNDTHQVHDVDVIGMLWNGLEDSLKKKGMLWVPQMGGEPYVLEGHVLAFKKGSAYYRTMPYMGDTSLSVRVDLNKGGARIATLESKRSVTFGKGTLTRKAWKKVFEEVSDDIVEQASKKF